MLLLSQQRQPCVNLILAVMCHHGFISSCNHITKFLCCRRQRRRRGRVLSTNKFIQCFTTKSENNNNYKQNHTRLDVIASTKKWVDTIVVGERLCPFVMPLKASNTLRYVASTAINIEQAVADVASQARLLMPDHPIPTTPMKIRRVNSLDELSDDDESDGAQGESTFSDFEDIDSKIASDDESMEMTQTSALFDSERAMWDVLSEAKSLLHERDDKPHDSASNDTEDAEMLTPGALARHYQNVMIELEEPLLRLKPPLPSRPHGATLIAFDAPFVLDFRDFEEVCEAVYRHVMYELNYYDALNIWIFHPNYLHKVYAQKTECNSVDYIMRSPYPTFLLIREVDLKAAYLSGYPYLRRLSAMNKDKFRNLISRVCQARLDSCYIAQSPNDEKN
jgi:hypothetical protein